MRDLTPNCIDRIEAYGITLRKVTMDDIEMVRVWRNDRKISEHMISNIEITPMMQKEWFNGITARNEIHFMINYNSEDIGLISIKSINYEERSFEPAIYIAKDVLQNSHVPFLATMCLGDFVYNNLGLNKPKVLISDDNHKAIRYNKFFGFKPTETVVKEKFRLYTLDSVAYEKACSALKRVLDL